MTLHLALDNNLSVLAKAQEGDLELDNSLSHGDSSARFLSGEILRPFIPQSLRWKVFELIQYPGHPGVKVSHSLIRKNYVWLWMHVDIKKWCKACLNCQRAKVSRHSILQPAHFVVPEGRCNHVHVDIVGPLPSVEGYSYCLTLIDRYSRWPEAIPLKNIEALTICRAFVDGWVSHFRSPESVTTDQGKQFESRIFSALLQLTGCQRIRTTPYHPAANGMVERWHRTLKSAIMCHSDRSWLRALSTVLMSLGNNILDSGASPAEFLYGKRLRVPGEFILTDDFSVDRQMLLEEFKENMIKVKPVPVSHRQKSKIFVHKNLNTCLHVFFRIVQSARKSLKPEVEVNGVKACCFGGKY